MTEDDAKKIIRALYTGKTLKSVLGPSPDRRKSFFELLSQNVVIQELYSHARAARADLYADEILEISDTESDAQKARNRIDARKWYASKMKPQTYGERIDLNVNQTVDVSGALIEARNRLIPRRYPENIEDAEIVETKQISSDSATGLESVDADWKEFFD